MNQLISNELSALDDAGATFVILSKNNIFQYIEGIYYDEIDVRLQYYDPRDDDVWTVDRFVKEVQGTDRGWFDCLYFILGNDSKVL